MIRIGIGFDVHPFVDNRPLWLGGVNIPHDRGLLGHSDADVLLHALCDALLGAVGLGDIGRHFPDTDPAYKGIASIELLRRVWQMIREQSYRLGNLDAVILAERPKIAPHVDSMTQVLTQELDASAGQINIKATTMERLGFVGREEGMAAQVAVVLVRDPESATLPKAREDHGL